MGAKAAGLAGSDAKACHVDFIIAVPHAKEKRLARGEPLKLRIVMKL